jgi:hypothetical protein
MVFSLYGDTKSIPGYFLQIVFFRDIWDSILRDPHKRVESSDWGQGIEIMVGSAWFYSCGLTNWSLRVWMCAWNVEEKGASVDCFRRRLPWHQTISFHLGLMVSRDIVGMLWKTLAKNRSSAE